MFLDIHDLAPGGLAFDHPVSIRDRADTDDDRPLVRDGRLRGTAVPTERGVEFRGRLDARVHLACSRCLEPFEVALGEDVTLTLVADAVEFGGKDARVGDEDATLFYTEGGRADLDEIAREQVLLSLPLKPVCEDGCRGLCPACGTNRNRLECGCRSDAVDPRLARLAEFRRRMR